MKRELLLDVSHDHTRAALIEDGMLSEIHVEKHVSSAQAENLYYGRIQSVRPSVHAAFVDIGDELNAFLPLDSDQTYRCGEFIIVQGTAKQATESKGLRITTRVNLAGKWLVLLPDSEGVHVSRKIKGDELRNALLDIARRICPEGCGLIVRTASEDVTEHLLEQEAADLLKRWKDICRKAQGMLRPGLLYQHETLCMRMIRDVRGLTRIVVNDDHMHSVLTAAQSHGWISSDVRIELFEEKKQLIFDAFCIEPQIDKALQRRVWLSCGGYLVIDPCEAMTVIDVNSGKMILGRSLTETALRVNLEAADEIARQIRLRDMGGIIIADFIDMKEPEHQQQLLARMKRAVASDRVPVKVEGITRLGLLEMTRKRIHASLGKQTQTSCSYCSGNGAVLSGEEVARRALRQIRRLSLAGQRGPFLIRCASAAANALSSMHNPLDNTGVYVLPTPGRHAERFDIEQLDAAALPVKGAEPLKALCYNCED